jgi:hypothetical protein
MAPAAAALSLAGWILLWGGPAPHAELEAQRISPRAFFPEHGLYALVCLGVYFVLLEAMLERRQFWKGLTLRAGLLWALVIAAVFALFPPLETVNYFRPSMGFLDRAARVLLCDPARVALYAAVAWGAVVGLRRLSLTSCLVAGHVLVMMKAHIAWDKYALPTLAALWWLHAWEGHPERALVSDAITERSLELGEPSRSS